jgi:hypothetical protein
VFHERLPDDHIGGSTNLSQSPAPRDRGGQ